MMDQYFTAPSFLSINQEFYVLKKDLSMGIKHESIHLIGLAKSGLSK